MAEPLSSSALAITIPVLATATIVTVAPDRLDLVALGAGGIAAGVCFLLAHNRREDKWVQWGWTLLTLCIGGLAPRSLCNRDYIQPTFSDFGLSGLIAGMLVPIILVAVWIALGRRAPTIASGVIRRGETIAGIDTNES